MKLVSIFSFSLLFCLATVSAQNGYNSEISDMSYESWQRRNQMNNTGHDQAINGVWERDAMANPYSGQQMNVETGYKYYYMNQNGQYFGTNDEFYNPAQDPRVNHLEWRKVQKPNNNGY